MVECCSRLVVTGAPFALFLLVCDSEPVRRILGAAARIYLGWAYVGKSLLSAIVECECVVCILYFFMSPEDV